MAARVLAIVNNIPKEYHSADLRNFFSQYIEGNCFPCFHFRHRPEIQRLKRGNNHENKETTCCVVRFDDDESCKKFIKLYDKKHWMDKTGQTLPTKCFVSKIKLDRLNIRDKIYLTQKEMTEIPENRENLTLIDFDQLPELNPPSVMPNGNVGTPTQTFLNLIRSCQLPATIIKKLGLIFPRSRGNRKYSNVPYNYGGEVVIGQSEDEERVLTATGHQLTNHFIRTIKYSKRKDEISSVEEMEEDDDDECEEWDRHEAFHNDVTQQDRTKERLYEEEIELQWEKGGSGLVFYTDAQHWDEEEGDFDAKTSDDWDLDMSVYYEKSGGDKDARDFIQMRREKRLRDGIEVGSVFGKKLGGFEKHTKGFGRKMLEKQGWKDGDGLGTTVIGIADALTGDGQHPSDKKGFGYRGEKLQRFNTKSKKRPYPFARISTVYDKRSDVIDEEQLLRSNLPTAMTYRLDQFLKGDS